MDTEELAALREVDACTPGSPPVAPKHRTKRAPFDMSARPIPTERSIADGLWSVWQRASYASYAVAFVVGLAMAARGICYVFGVEDECARIRFNTHQVQLDNLRANGRAREAADEARRLDDRIDELRSEVDALTPQRRQPRDAAARQKCGTIQAGKPCSCDRCEADGQHAPACGVHADEACDCFRRST